MSQENVTALRHGFELWNVASSDPDEQIWRKALAEMVAGYHPDAEIDFSRTLPDFPDTGVVEAMSGWVEAARGMFTDVRLEPRAIIDAGDAAVATMRVTGTGGMSGAPVDAEIFYVFRFRDGLVSAATTYMTEQEALTAVGLEESAMSQENVELVQRLIAALSERDAEGYVALCTPDVQMVSPVAAIEGTTVGAAGIRQFFSGLIEAWSEFHIDVQRIQAVGDDRVLALMNMCGVSEGGIPIVQPLSSVYDLAAGRLRRVHVYLDRAEALKAAGLEE